MDIIIIIYKEKIVKIYSKLKYCVKAELYTKKHALRRAFLCGDKGSRTPDLLNAIQTRYQLRYIPVCFFIIL